MKRIILKDGTEFEIVVLASNAGYRASFCDRSEYDRLRLKMNDDNLSEHQIYTIETQETVIIKDKTVTSIKTLELINGEINAEFYLADIDTTQKKLIAAESTISELQYQITKLSSELSITQEALDYIMFSTLETTEQTL